MRHRCHRRHVPDRGHRAQHQVPVVVDLWAPWCGPCRTLGPIIEKVIDATDGQVVLVKVNVDENPQIATAFRAQSIPAVYAVKGGQIGRRVHRRLPGGRRQRSSSSSLLPTEGEQEIAAAPRGRRRGQPPPGPRAGARTTRPSSSRWPSCSSTTGATDEALALLARIPETEPVRLLAARARLGQAGDRARGADDGAAASEDDYDAKLEGLLAAGARRRGRPSGVRGHPRGDGPRGPPDRAVPPPAHQPPVLRRLRRRDRRPRRPPIRTAIGAAGSDGRRCGWSDVTASGCWSAVRCHGARQPSRSAR